MTRTRTQRRAELSRFRRTRVKRERRERQFTNWLYNMLKRFRWRDQQGPEALAVRKTVNRMTNWQRTQWARAGYDRERVEEFAALQRPVR